MVIKKNKKKTKISNVKDSTKLFNIKNIPQMKDKNT